MVDFKRAEEISECLFTQEEVEHAITCMAAKMTEDLADKNPIILCLMTGGIVICGQLMTQLHFPLQLDYIHATRYLDDTKGQALTWRATPRLSLKDRHVVLVDDILDGGITLSDAKNYCENQGAKKVDTAVLLDKPSGRLELGLQKATYVGLEVKEGWVYGYGLDVGGYLRNVNAIHSLDPSQL